MNRMTTSELMKRFAPYYFKYWKALLVDLFCAALTTLCEIVLPLILRAGGKALRRAEAAHQHCQGISEKSADSDSR